jgi:class 3 adenylate cyclase
VARWLAGQGFPRVAILAEGLAGWRAAGFAVERLEGEPAPVGEGAGATPAGPAQGRLSFLPSLADRFLVAGARPARRRLATLFVDIAGSTRLLAHHPPERVLAVVQRFMRLVTEVALAYCGDVKDFEGDGALLYFESAAEATEAAFAIRSALARGPDPSAPIGARMSLTVGDVVIGLVGSAMRQAVALVGPSVSVGARLLKQIPPGGIIASAALVESLRDEAPGLAARFRLEDAAFEVPGGDGMTLATYVVSDP